MPTRKQRRRDAKSRRHEYEYVYVDDEGNEVAVDEHEQQQEREAKRESRSQRANTSKAPVRAGGRRTVEPPSWRRSGRRALIFRPLLIVAMMFFNRDLTLVQQVFPAVFLIAFFIPFSYFTDSLAYRIYQRRLARQNPNAKAR
jgi:hypothetical protein